MAQMGAVDNSVPKRHDGYRLKNHGFEEPPAPTKSARTVGTQLRPATASATAEEPAMVETYDESETATVLYAPGPVSAPDLKCLAWEKQQRLYETLEYEESLRCIAEDQRLDEEERIEEERAIARVAQQLSEAKRGAGIALKPGERLLTRAEATELVQLMSTGMTEVQATRALTRRVRSSIVIDCSKLAELKEAPARRPVVVEGVLRAGEVADFVASSKVGKSWSMLQLLLSIAAGIPWLGKFATKQGHVILFDNELHMEELQNRVWRVADAIGVLPALRFMKIKSVRGALQDMKQIRDIIADLADQQRYIAFGVERTDVL